MRMAAKFGMAVLAACCLAAQTTKPQSRELTLLERMTQGG